MITDHPSELAEMIMSWNDAGVDAFATAMRLSEVDSAVVRQAMKIVREELVPATAAREADFRRRGRYSTAAELREMTAAGEAKRQAQKEAGLERFKDVFVETLMATIAEHPGPDGAELERAFRERLARRAAE